MTRESSATPSSIYLWLVPSEEVQEQPGSWRIRKWDTEPFPEATHECARSESAPKEPAVLVPIATLEKWGEALSPYTTEGSYNNDGVIDTIAEMATFATKGHGHG